MLIWWPVLSAAVSVGVALTYVLHSLHPPSHIIYPSTWCATHLFIKYLLFVGKGAYKCHLHKHLSLYPMLLSTPSQIKSNILQFVFIKKSVPWSSWESRSLFRFPQHHLLSACLFFNIFFNIVPLQKSESLPPILP